MFYNFGLKNQTRVHV